MTEHTSYEITVEKITKTEDKSKAEVLTFFQGETFHIQTGIGRTIIDLCDGDVLLVLRRPPGPPVPAREMTPASAQPPPEKPTGQIFCCDTCRSPSCHSGMSEISHPCRCPHCD